MQVANYTSENIVRALGLEGFANDHELALADESIRLLLLPSFHGEICLSFVKRGSECKLSVVVAREQIWLQSWPIPKPVATAATDEPVAQELFHKIASALRLVGDSKPLGVVILDGMRVHAVLRSNQQCQLNINENVGERLGYSEFVAFALTEAWQAVALPVVRNALRNAAEYVGIELLEEPEPAEKVMVRTVVLGPEDLTAKILDSFKRHHGS